MNFKYLVFIAIFGALASGCATGNGTAGNAGDETREVAVRVTEGPATAEADDDDVVCTREHRVGSNFPRTVCKTRAEREAARRNSEQTIRAEQQRSAAGRIRSGENF